MDKDPAFLLYSKDWLQGTASMTLEEKAIYIDLLCHQHQDGFIPYEVEKLARMVGINLEEFKKAWITVSTKFQPKSNQKSTNGSVLVNAKLERVMIERLELAEKNRILGALSGIIRNAISPSKKKEIRKKFDYDEFKDYWHEILNLAPTNCQPDVSQTLNQWLTKRQPPLEDEDEDEDEDAIENENSNGIEGLRGKGKIDWAEEKKRFIEDTVWHEVIQRSYRIDETTFKSLASKFLKMLDTREKKMDLKEMKNYFCNWYDKNLEKQKMA